jgi:hypothetical protein
LAFSLKEETGHPKYVRFQVVENMTVVISVINAFSDITTEAYPSHSNLGKYFNELFATNSINPRMPPSIYPGCTYSSPMPNVILMELTIR